MKKIKILLINVEGLSTKDLMIKIINEGKKIGVDVTCETVLFEKGKEIIKEWDVVLICPVGPRLKYYVAEFENNYSIPVGVITFLLYGTQNGKGILDLALELVSKGKE